MTTSPPDVPVKYVADCSVGGPTDGVTVVPLTQDEIDQRAKDALDAKAREDAIAAAENQKALDHQAGIDALKKLGLTDAMISAMLT